MSTTKHANSTLPTATLRPFLGRLDRLARSTGLIRRSSRKFSADGFLLTLFHGVCRGNASFEAMASQLANFNPASLTRQSLHQRFNEKTIGFLRAVLASLIKDQEGDRVGRMRFGRLLVQDSSQFWMNRKNAEHYRGVSNNSGTTAAAKLDLIMDLQSGQFVDCEEVEARTQDRSLGPRLLDEVRKHDLVVRDLGYFDVSGFQSIEQSGGNWVSRLHGTADVILENGRTLESLLDSTDQSFLDLPVSVTAKKHRARLIAIRLPEEVANRRRQQKKEKRAKNRTSAKKGTLIREGWNLYLTSLSAEQCSLEDVVKFYEQRWQIEIQFRAIKQSTQMKKALGRISNKFHLQALMIAAMIFATLTVRVHRYIACTLRNPLRLSIEKTAKWLSQSITFIRSPNEPLSYDLRHLMHDRRRRRTLKELHISLLQLN